MKMLCFKYKRKLCKDSEKSFSKITSLIEVKNVLSLSLCPTLPPDNNCHQSHILTTSSQLPLSISLFPHFL